MSKNSLVYTALISYLLPALFTVGINIQDKYYLFYSVFLAYYSIKYHYYEEKKYFYEDFWCSIFTTIYIYTNYIISKPLFTILKYLFLSHVLGLFIFILSYYSWNYKDKNNYYTCVHNLWHFYTGINTYFVTQREEIVPYPKLNSLYLTVFLGIIFIPKIKKIISYK